MSTAQPLMLSPRRRDGMTGKSPEKEEREGVLEHFLHKETKNTVQDSTHTMWLHGSCCRDRFTGGKNIEGW